MQVTQLSRAHGTPQSLRTPRIVHTPIAPQVALAAEMSQTWSAKRVSLVRLDMCEASRQREILKNSSSPPSRFETRQDHNKTYVDDDVAHHRSPHRVSETYIFPIQRIGCYFRIGTRLGGPESATSPLARTGVDSNFAIVTY